MTSGIATWVVDDEPLARRRLLHLLDKVPDINVIGAFGSATEAQAQAPEMAPQLLLLDIRMPELDGFELVNALAAQGLTPYIIFVTAHSDRSLDAFAVGAIDYLLKPFDDERFARAIERARTLIASGATSKRHRRRSRPRSPATVPACCSPSTARSWCCRCGTSSLCRRPRST